jgi:hypothetical protein
MKIIKEIGLKGLTMKQKAIVTYFVVSLLLTGSVVEAPILGIVLIFLNFSNSVRLINKISLPEIE